MSRRKSSKKLLFATIVLAFEILILIGILFFMKESTKYFKISVKENSTINGIDFSVSTIIDKGIALIEKSSFPNAEITYQLPNNETYILDSDTLRNWLIQDENVKYFRDEEIWNKSIENFVENELSSLANQIDNPKEFKPTGKDYTVFVKNENYSYLIDTEAEIQKLKEDLENKNVITRTPCYKNSSMSDENYGLGKSYIEIDLTRQKVWVYVDGNLEIETDCVTGCIDKGHETPTGIFTLTYKEKDRILRGQKLANGKYEYESPVSFWMPFNGGIGLHDATWRSSFGGNIYISNGSHGCINLPFSAAEKLYNLIDNNMPIIVYKS